MSNATLVEITSSGAKAPSASLSVVPAGFQYETVAASQTAQVLGATGAVGDYLSHVILQPATTAAGTTTPTTAIEPVALMDGTFMLGVEVLTDPAHAKHLLKLSSCRQVLFKEIEMLVKQELTTEADLAAPVV